MQLVDANLVLSLDALLREESVFGAARRMNVSAPAMSRTLARLRKATGDALFVRAGHRMLPTPRALELRERVRLAAEEVRSILRPNERLDLGTLVRIFTLHANDYSAVLLGRSLDALVRAQAPHVTLRIVAEGPNYVREEMLRSGEIDLDVGVHTKLHADLRVQTVYHDRMVAVVREGHPLASKRLTPRRFATGAGHVAISRRGLTTGPIDARLKELGLTRTVQLVVPAFLAGAWVAAESDYIVPVPWVLAKHVAPILKLRILEIPLVLDPVNIAQAWHPRFDGDPAHAWLRKTVRRALRDRG
ncbi:LysR family transcriptional regulator [Pendulispora albinea]|uniref:LysR family transcriptional regulator n=1 Tax=Pendulispora albinea TaxID=2741071 RepID=A0ABZ2M8U8_9BACT